MINIVTLSGHNFPIKIAFHAAARYHDTFFVTGGSNLKSDELDTIYRWGILCIFEILDNFSSQLLRYDVMSDSFTLTEARLQSPITEHSTVMLDNLCTNMTHLSVLKSVLKEVCCIKQFKVLKYQLEYFCLAEFDMRRRGCERPDIWERYPLEGWCS